MSCPRGVPEIGAPRLVASVFPGSCVVVAGVAVNRSETGCAGKPCGRIPGSSADVAGIDEVGLIRASETGRCESQNQAVIDGNYCRKDIHGRNVHGSAMPKRLT